MINISLSILLWGALLFCAIGLAYVLGNRVAELLRRRRNSPEKLAADRLLYEQRILNPDWAFYERHLQRPVPQALRELYADERLILKQCINFGQDVVINAFDALDEEGLIDSRPWLGFDAVVIATNEFGDIIYLRPGADEPDAVYLTHHDGGDTEELAPNVSIFVERIRDANRNILS